MTTSYHLPEKGQSRTITTPASHKEQRKDLEKLTPPAEDIESNYSAPPMYSPSREQQSQQGWKSPYVTTVFEQYPNVDHERNHEIALRELTKRPATPPPFPDALPNRLSEEEKAEKERRERRKWTFWVAGITLLLVIIIIILGILIALRIIPGKKQQMPITAVSNNNSSSIPIFPVDSTTTATSTELTKTVFLNFTETVAYSLTPTATTTTTTTTTTKKKLDLGFLTRSTIAPPSSSSSFSSTTTTTTTPTEEKSTTQTAPEVSPTCNTQDNLILSSTQCSFVATCNNDENTVPTSDPNCLHFCTVVFGPPSTSVSNSNSNTNSNSSISISYLAEDSTHQKLCANIDSFGTGVDDDHVDELVSMKGRIHSCCGECGCF